MFTCICISVFIYRAHCVYWKVLITEGEFDALAVAEALCTLQHSSVPHRRKMSKIKVFSLPNGCNSLPPGVLPLLERFSRIYLWVDNDPSGQAAAQKFTQKLGIHRCLLVKPLRGDPSPAKDANDVLRRTDIRDHDILMGQFLDVDTDYTTLSDKELAMEYIFAAIR